MSRRRKHKGGKRSGFEVSIAEQLDEAAVDYEYESLVFEYTEPLRKNLAECGECGSTNLIRTGRYTPDFVLANGTIIESKGRFEAKDRRKMLAVREDYPEYRWCIVFMVDNKISRRSETRYSDWCMQHEYEFSIGQVNKEWLK